MDLLKVCDNDRIFTPSHDDMIRLINPLLLVFDDRVSVTTSVKPNHVNQLNQCHPKIHNSFGRGVSKVVHINSPRKPSSNPELITEDQSNELYMKLDDMNFSDVYYSSRTSPVASLK